MHSKSPVVIPFAQDILRRAAKRRIEELADELCCQPKELVAFLRLSIDSYLGRLNICWSSPGLKQHTEERNVHFIREPEELYSLIDETLEQLEDYLQPTIARLKAANHEKIKAKEEEDWNASLKSRLRNLRRLHLDQIH